MRPFVKQGVVETARRVIAFAACSSLRKWLAH
jgi:hypothetical protein